MNTRSIIVPKFTVADVEGKQFASRVMDAEAALTSRGLTDVTVTQTYDSEGNIVACKVTGLIADDVQQDAG